jgi:hypothetical protein
MAVNLKGPATKGVAGLESTLWRFPLRVAGGLGPTFGDNAANAGECPGASLRGRREVVRLLVCTSNICAVRADPVPGVPFVSLPL